MAWKRSVRNSSVLADAKVVVSLAIVFLARYELPGRLLCSEMFQLPDRFGQLPSWRRVAVG